APPHGPAATRRRRPTCRGARGAPSRRIFPPTRAAAAGRRLDAQPAAQAGRAGGPGAPGGVPAVRDRPGDPAAAEPRDALEPGGGAHAPDRSRDRQPALRPRPAPAAQAPRRRRLDGVSAMNEASVEDDLSAEVLLGKVADEFTQRLNRGEQPQIEEY